MDMKRIVRGLALALALAAAAGGGALAAGEAVLRTAPENDFRTDQQYSYLTDPDVGNVFAYARGAEQLSRPEGIVCDFSGDGIGEAETYVIQKASSADFADAVTVKGLRGKSHAFHNLLLGEHFFWRAGTSTETIGESPAHEVTVTALPPRICCVEGVTNVRDVGGYASSLVPGGVIRQGLYYRGANLSSVTKKGQRRLTDELGVRVEIDLRDRKKCGGPYVKGVEYHPVSIPSGTEDRRFEEFSEEYGKVFALIANADEKPVFLHCHAGADRTGIVTFILLTVCGAGYEDVARDYLLTNFAKEGPRYLESEFAKWWEKLELFAGDTKADKAKSWLMLKGVPAERVERIREIFVEGYRAE